MTTLEIGTTGYALELTTPDATVDCAPGDLIGALRAPDGEVVAVAVGTEEDINEQMDEILSFILA